MANRQGYFNLPRFIGVNYGDTAQLRCITVFVPDGDEYVGQLLALMNVAGQKSSWFTPNDAMRIARSEIWQEAYRKTLEAIMCGCFDCDDVAGCIETSDAVKNALQAFFNAGGNTNPVGEQLPPGKMTENIVAGTNPTCDYDILWAQCIGLVQWCNAAIEQFFQGFETLTNSLEIANAVSKLPVLDELGADAIADYAVMAQAAVQENYAADYTPAYEEELACAIFCACKVDCEITLERIFNILLVRVQAQWGSLVNLDNLVDMLNDIVSMDIEVINVADMIFFMLFGSANLANFGLNITAAFDAIQRAILIFDEPNNDWEVLCTECSWSHEWDFTVNDGGWQSSTIAGQGGTWNSTDGWYFTSTASGGSLRIWKDYTGALGGIITGWEMDVVIPQQGSTARRVGFDAQDLDGSPTSSMVNKTDATTGTHTYSGAVSFTPVNAGMAMFSNHFNVTNGQKYKCLRIRLSGTGDDPFA